MNANQLFAICIKFLLDCENTLSVTRGSGCCVVCDSGVARQSPVKFGSVRWTSDRPCSRGRCTAPSVQRALSVQPRAGSSFVPLGRAATCAAAASVPLARRSAASAASARRPNALRQLPPPVGVSHKASAKRRPNAGQRLLLSRTRHIHRRFSQQSETRIPKPSRATS